MQGKQGQIQINKEIKSDKEGEGKIEAGLEIRGGTVSECESGVLTVTGALRLHDT